MIGCCLLVVLAASTHIAQGASIWPVPGASLNFDKDGIFEGDIKLTDNQKKAVKRMLENQGKAASPSIDASGQKFGLTNVYPPWDNGVVVYSYAPSIRRGSAQDYSIQAAMREWTTKTNRCITFRRRTNERNYLEFHIGSGCWGHIGQPNGKSQISVGSGCQYQHVMSHEIGHVLGFWHEQSRTDRDSYLQILWQNVPAQFKEAFAKYGKDKIDSLGVPYDYTSIMHYPWNAFSTTGRDTVRPIRRVPAPGPYKRISPLDVKQVKLFYKCGTKPPVKPPTRRPPVKPKTGPQPVTKCVTEEVDSANSGGSCRDKSPSCSSWASRGECRRNPAYMKPNCCKSCGGTNNRNCRDKSGSCRSWAANGECGKNPAYMNVNCKKSCRKCGTTTRQRCYTVAPPQPKTDPIVWPSPPIPTTKSLVPSKRPPLPPTKLPPTKPPVTSDCETAEPAGLKDKLSDSAFSASSEESKWHAAKFARLDNKPDDSSVGAWCAAVSNADQWLQVDLAALTTVKAIKIQGREGHYAKRVKKFYLSYSADGKKWFEFLAAKKFVGNEKSSFDAADVKFDIPMLARYVRVHPVDWNNQICLRLELMVCPGKD